MEEKRQELNMVEWDLMKSGSGKKPRRIPSQEVAIITGSGEKYIIKLDQQENAIIISKQFNHALTCISITPVGCTKLYIK